MPTSMSRSTSRHRSPSPYSRRERYSRRSPSPSPRRRYSRDRDRSRPRSRNDRYRSRSRDRRRSPPPRSGRYYNDFHNEDLINGVEKLPNETFMEYRMRVRDSSTATIWAPSPEPRRRSVTPEDHTRRKKRSKRHVSDSEDESDSDDSDSDDERHRRRRKHKSKKSSSKKKSHRSSKKKRRRSVTPSDSSPSESESEKEVKNEVVLDQAQLDSVEDLWVEKEVNIPDEDNTIVGPVMLPKDDMPDERAYGSALLPGEGSAMAAYVQQGKRIPRRGEIGLSGDKIADFEGAGFVMSGSRHQRMNAVRLRKENQVISAEEKRLLLQHAQEQKVKHENEIISGFRELLDEKFNSSRTGGN